MPATLAHGVQAVAGGHEAASVSMRMRAGESLESKHDRRRGRKELSPRAGAGFEALKRGFWQREPRQRGASGASPMSYFTEPAPVD